MFQSIIDTINSLGYVGIALLMALENILPPIPSELIMPLAGFAVTQGKLKFSYVVIAGTIGSVLGATPWYFLGKLWGLKRTRKIADRYGKWLTLSGEDIEKAKNWFNRRGYIATAIGRLVPGIRTYISLLDISCKKIAEKSFQNIEVVGGILADECLKLFEQL